MRASHVAVGALLRVAAWRWWWARPHRIDEHVWSSPELNFHAMAECRHRAAYSAGGACRSPALLAAIGGAVGACGPAVATAAAFAGDLAAAGALDAFFGRSRAAFYLWNPIVAVAAAAGSAQSWLVAAALAAALAARRRRPVLAGAVAAAVAAVDASFGAARTPSRENGTFGV